MPAGLHPLIVHFPIALIFCVLLLEFWAIARRRPADPQMQAVLLCFCLLATVAAFISGYQANDLANAAFIIADEQIAPHHAFGRLLLFIIPLTLAFQLAAAHAKHGRRGFFWAYIISLLLTACLVAYTALLGSELVYRYGAGVGG